MIDGPLPDALLSRLENMGADTGTLGRLRDLHGRLWALEDCARSTHATDREIVEVKRAIDRHNSERHRLIDELDASLSRRPALSRGTLWLETVGELCDRLLILRLKAQHAAALAQDFGLPDDARDACADHELRFLKWCAHLERGMGRLLDDVADGRADLPPRSEFKIYNEAILNPVTRAEMGVPS